MKVIYQLMPFILGLGLMGCNANDSVNHENTKDNNETSNNEITAGNSEFVSALPESAPIMKVGITNSGAPFVLQDENGIHKGVDIDIMRAIGEEQGFKVQFYVEKWKNLLPSVENGKYDVVVNGINYSEARAQKYGLSHPYFYNPSAVMYLNGTKKITSLEDLVDLKVEVVEQSKQYDQLKNIVGNTELTTAPTSFLLFEHLMQGKVDAIAMDMPMLQHTAKQYPDVKVRFLAYESEKNLTANTVIVMAKGNNDLIKSVNEGIDQIKENGEYAKIKEKWLGLEEK